MIAPMEVALISNYPAGIYLLKVSNRNTRARYELTIKTQESRWHRSSVFIVNFEHISYLVLVVSIANV